MNSDSVIGFMVFFFFMAKIGSAGDIPSLQRFLQEIWIHLFADHLVPIPEKDVVKLYWMTIPYRMEKSGFCRHSPFRYFAA